MGLGARDSWEVIVIGILRALLGRKGGHYKGLRLNFKVRTASPADERPARTLMLECEGD